jgi:hypothetical protein
MATEEDIPNELRLHALFGGGLNDEERQALLDRMKPDAELKRTYRELLDVENAIRKDAGSLTLPREATIAVFTALGLSVPAAAPRLMVETDAAPVALAPAAEPVASAVPAAWAGWQVSRLSMAVWCSIAVLVAGFFLLRNTNSPGGRKAQVERHESALPSASTPVAAAVDARSSSSAAQQTGLKKTAGARGLTTRSELSVLSAREGRPSEAIDMQTRELSPNTIDALKDLPVTPFNEPTGNYGVPVTASHIDERRLGLILTCRGLIATAFPAVNVPSQSATSMKNFGIGVMFPLDETQRVGLEVGREAFPQRFGRIESEVYASYTQNPLEYWLSACYDWTFVSFPYSNISLFSRMNAGAAWEVGPMLRASVGARLGIIGRMECSLAAEGMLAAYRFETLWLTSKKIGVTAGIAITF